jgi:apolipoprotein N-acyltransferase
MALAFPPVGWWWAVLVAVVPLGWATMNLGPGQKRRALLVGLGVWPFWLWVQSYLAEVAFPGYVGFSIYLAVFDAGFVLIGAWLHRRLAGGAGGGGIGRVAAPFALAAWWASLSFLKGEMILQGYPWFQLAHPLIDVAWVSAWASWLGVYFASFLVALLGFAALAASRRSTRAGGVAGLVVVAAALAGGAVEASRAVPVTRTVRVGVVQTQVPQNNKNAWKVADKVKDFERFIALTRQAGGGESKPRLILWPETMFPGMALNASALDAEREARLAWTIDTPTGPLRLGTTSFHDTLITVQAELGVPMIVGAIAVEGLTIDTASGGRVKLKSEHRYNSAFLIYDGIVREARYDKMVLTPFGEVIPYLWRFPWLQKWVVGLGAEGMEFDLAYGQRPTVLMVPEEGQPPLRVVTPICYEATVAPLCRALAFGPEGRRADFMASLSNDGWFGSMPGGREQHLLFARWRCVELGLAMVRSVNTGVSAVIDARGRMIARGPAVDTDGVLVADVPVTSEEFRTLYSRVGEVFGWGCVGAWLVVLVAAWRRGEPRG